MGPVPIFCTHGVRPVKHLLPLAALAVALGAADKPAADKKTDKDRIQGTWVVTGVEAQGAAVKEGDQFDQLQDTKLTFQDDAVLNAKHPDAKATFTLDPDKKPATIDVDVQGREQALSRLLYEFKDDNTLLLCCGKNLAERPTEFGSKDDQIIITLKRQEKKPEK
jgi:uncharacterized protein (TIGR03067 family)